jgi:hypothetical protein
MTWLVRVARAFLREQVYLHQRYLDAYEVSGTEAVEAMRRLRWCNDRLIGDWIPLPR